MIHIKKLNETYIKVDCNDSIAMELSNEFVFTVENYKFMNAYKFGGWDGKIRLFNLNKKTLYTGLKDKLIKYLSEQGYEYSLDSELNDVEYSAYDAKEFTDSFNTPFKMKDYQLKAFIAAIRKRRGLFISPTGSGKSFLIYNLMRAHEGRKLLIVPNILLLNQMLSDFKEYDLDKSIIKNIQFIKEGQTKEITKEITVSTWQSIYKLPKKWFDQFNVLVGDEAHLFSADALKGIMEKADKIPHKFGVTGTLNGSKLHAMVLEGLFGPIKIVAKTKDLMDSGDLAKLKIKSILLKYPDSVKKQVKGLSYHDEMDFLFNNEKRNKFIEKLALSLEGNTLIIFSKIDHGKALYESINLKNKNPSYLIYGAIDGDEREEIRKIVNTHKTSIICGSSKTTSIGLNIPNLNNIIFTSPSKALITVMQSIGRGTRVTPLKNSFTLYDIADDLSWKKHQNYTLKHYFERIKMYITEKLEYKQYNVGIKE